MDIRNLTRIAGVVLIAGLFTVAAAAQSSELILRAGVSPHVGVDDVYRKFSESYRTLNVDQIADQYTQTAAYLAPDDEVLTGRDSIRPGFKRFFDSVKGNGQTMAISFEIVQRMVDKTIGYDVGIFTLSTFKDGKEINRGRGKFVVVTVKDADGKWRFQVDGYSGIMPKLPK